MEAPETKICRRCGETKHPEDFYRRSGTDQRLAECKQCMKGRASNHAPIDRTTPTVPSESAVIDILTQLGIPALPGKALSQKFTDVVAWGCVHIEVKRAKPRVGNRYHWRLTAKQKAGGLHGDLIVLVKDKADGPVYHVFRADDPIFFRGLNRRETIPHVENAKHRKIGFRDGIAMDPITDEDMDDGKNRWDLIEAVRVEKSAALRATARERA